MASATKFALPANVVGNFDHRKDVSATEKVTQLLQENHDTLHMMFIHVRHSEYLIDCLASSTEYPGQYR